MLRISSAKRLIFGLTCLLVIAWPVSAESRPFTVGAILSLTGPAAFFGQEVQRGLELARDELNQEAGRPYRFELAIEDSAARAEAGVAAYQKLRVSKNPPLVISMLSSVSLPVSFQAEQNRIPLLVLVSSAPSVTAGKTWTFRYFPTAEVEIAAIADQLARMHVKRLGLLYLEDEFGLSIRNELDGLMRRTGGALEAQAFLGSDTDFRTQIARLRAADIDAIYIVGLTGQLIAAIRQVEQLGLSVPVFGPSTLSDPGIRTSLKDLTFPIYLSSPTIYDPRNTGAEAFKAAYRERFHKEPSHSAANGYDALRLISAALAKGAGPAPSEVRDALEHVPAFSAVQGETRIDSAHHEISFPLVPAALKSGVLEY